MIHSTVETVPPYNNSLLQTRERVCGGLMSATWAIMHEGMLRGIGHTQYARLRTVRCTVTNSAMHASHDMKADKLEIQAWYLNRNMRCNHSCMEADIQAACDAMHHHIHESTCPNPPACMHRQVTLTQSTGSIRSVYTMGVHSATCFRGVRSVSPFRL